jgi:hypothetical protein
VLLMVLLKCASCQIEYYEKLNKLMENIVKWNNFNAKTSLYFVDKYWKNMNIDKQFFNDPTKDTAQILYRLEGTKEIDIHGYPLSRDHNVCILLNDVWRSDKLLNRTNDILIKLPNDLIKILFIYNDCDLNEEKLGRFLENLWQVKKTSFIYYFSYCHFKLNGDCQQQNRIGMKRPHNDCRKCSVINLYYYHPFDIQTHNNENGKQSRKWERMKKIILINDCGDRKMEQDLGNEREIYGHFPFRKIHNINLNQILFNAILFPSAMAFQADGLTILKKHLNADQLKNPFRYLEAYFGEDVEFGKELAIQMNFTLNVTRESDMGFYGYKVSFFSKV